MLLAGLSLAGLTWRPRSKITL
ncbi:hypothetical protein GM672_23350 [Massilia buxea]|nr:hypothetical protein [Pseudoduganella buxea]